MSTGAVTGLALSCTAWLLAASLVQVIRLNPFPLLSCEAKGQLDALDQQFARELRNGAQARATERGRTELTKRDIRDEYRERRVRKMGAFKRVTRFGGITISGAGLAIALPALPHFPPLSPVATKFLSIAGFVAAAIAMIYDSSEFLRDMVKAQRRRKHRPDISPAPVPDAHVSAVIDNELKRRRERLAKEVEREARRQARQATITPEDVRSAWLKLVKPYAVAAPHAALARSRNASLLRDAAAFVEVAAVTTVLYFTFSLVKTRLPTGQYWPVAAIAAALVTLYLLVVNAPRIIAAAASVVVPSLARLAGKSGVLAGTLFRRTRKDRSLPSPDRPSTTPPVGGTEDLVLAERTPGRDYQAMPPAASQVSPFPASAMTSPSRFAFSLGWLMARLFGPLRHQRVNSNMDHLPAVAELDGDYQIRLAILELRALLRPYPGLSCAGIEAAWETPDHAGFTAAVTAMHLELLAWLVPDLQQLGAYQLGRALSDTCWLPNEQAGADFFLQQFDGRQIATLQTWLIQAGGGALPALSAAIASRSLQHWQDWADINASKIRAKWVTAHGPVVAALRTQAQAWFALLAGTPDTTSPPNLGALVRAGDSTLRATGRLRLAAARRSWLVTMILAAATGGLLYLAIANTSGIARVWTSLAITAAALAITGANLRVAVTTATRAIDRDIGHAARLEAQV